MKSADEIAEMMVDTVVPICRMAMKLLLSYQIRRYPVMELYILYNKIEELLSDKGIRYTKLSSEIILHRWR